MSDIQQFVADLDRRVERLNRMAPGTAHMEARIVKQIADALRTEFAQPQQREVK